MKGDSSLLKRKRDSGRPPRPKPRSLLRPPSGYRNPVVIFEAGTGGEGTAVAGVQDRLGKRHPIRQRVVAERLSTHVVHSNVWKRYGSQLVAVKCPVGDRPHRSGNRYRSQEVTLERTIRNEIYPVGNRYRGELVSGE